MAKLSKFVKVDKNILLEYIYDDDNNIGESYEVLVNSKDRKQSYLATSTSGTNNTQNNSLFVLDKVSNKYGKIDTSQYSFLQLRSYSSSTPIRHDKLVVHLPINWTFGEYLGFYVKIFAYDVLNQTSYDLSNFYFDMTDASQGYIMNFTSPPLLFAEKLWGKNITIEFPSVSAIASQRVNNRPKESSLNANLTNGSGFSLNTPVFIDFHFINNIQTINAVTSYLLNPKVSVSVPQAPEFENLGLKIEHSSNGDFFEIYGTYNGTISGFKQFIDDSFNAGSRYYVQYSITTFEQNVRGKTITAEVIDNFNETIEFRPIIKGSTTTAIIDVEMRLVDAVSESTITRRASYGMLQDEVSKYSLNLSKINLRNASKPKIYNTRSGSGFGDANSGLGLGMGNGMGNNINVSTIKVPFPVMIDRSNIIGKSDNVIYQKDKYYGIGKLLINVFPFDNIINFVIALDFTGTSDTASQIQYLDMSGMNDIKMEFKNSAIDINVPIYRDAENNLEIGQVVFKIPKSKIPDIRKIYESGINVFYITTTTDDVTTVIYTGLYKMYDSASNVDDLNQNIPTLSTVSSNPIIIDDPNTKKETAIVTRKKVLSSETTSAIKKGG